MDIIAFALLGIGTLLVLLGIVFNYLDNRYGHGNLRSKAKESFERPRQQEPATAAFRVNEMQPQQPRPVVDVMVSLENPKLFQKRAFLYFDQSNSNSYSGAGAVFSLEDVSGIKRVGEGVFSYDGFAFSFVTNNDSKQSYLYNVENLEHIAFYPNCVVLTNKEEQYPALLFTDETESIRKVLETFKVEA